MHQEVLGLPLREVVRDVYAGVLAIMKNGLALVGLATVGFVLVVLSRTQAVSPDAPDRFSPRNIAAAADQTLRTPLAMLAGVLSVPAEKLTALLGLKKSDMEMDLQGLEAAHNVNGPRPRTAALPSEKKAQDGMTRYLVRKYRISADAVSLLVEAAYETGRQITVDPALLLAVMAIESGFNPFAESVMGAQGLMQVMSRVHSDKLEDFGGPRAALNPVANMRVGALILKDCIRRGGSVADGLRLYSGAGIGDDAGYGAKVMQEQERIQTAAGLPGRALASARAVVVRPAAVSVAPEVEAVLAVVQPS